MEQVCEYLSLSEAYGKKPSFTALVRERFSDDIHAEIDRYCRFYQVDFSSVTFHKVIVKSVDIGASCLYFDVLFNCVKTEGGKKQKVEMVVDCCCNLNNELETVHTRGACPTWKSYHPTSILPDDLVPVISKKDLDRIATQIVKTLYPRAMDYAVPMSIGRITRELGLTVQDVCIDEDGEVLGKIFFEDAHTVTKDWVTGITSIIPVTKGTIFVNTLPGKITDNRIRNNTIIHECIHWLLHRPAFLLAKLWNREYNAVACRRPTSTAVSRPWTSLDRMEWQANALAPRVLMPEWATHFIAENWLHRYNRLSPNLRMEKTIDRLSQHFDVSRQLAKIRMMELGYHGAKDAFAFYEKQQHDISFENAATELRRNDAFREALESGIYAYVDNCFVLRDSKFIYRADDGVLHLTAYAKSRLDECSLAFASRRVNRGMRYGMLRYCVEDESFIVGTAVSASTFKKQTQTVANILNSLPASFSETLCAHMKRKGITVEQLAENCLQSSRTIGRYRNAPYPAISLQGVVGLCIGLKLHPMLATDLIRKAGFTLTASPSHSAYQMLILTMSNSSIYECNELLVKMGMKPLGSE